MGIIVKQSIKGSIWSYLGVLIGFVTTSYLYPKYLTTDTVGLFSLFISYATLLGQLSLLGLPVVTSRMFPIFRNKDNSHNGFVFLSMLILAFGFLIFLLGFALFAPYLAETNQQKSALFAEYLYLLIPLTFFTMLFVQLDTYNKVLYDAVYGTYLQEFFQRVLLLLITVAFALKLITLTQLVYAFTVAISLKALMITYFLYRKGELNFRPQLHFISTGLRREIISVGLYSIFASLGYLIVFNVDKIMINQMLDLSNTGVYTIAFYFGSLVVIPSRPLLKISGTLIADAWAQNDIKKIDEIYYKSCINQFIIGAFLFVGLWANIDNILQILGDDYAQSKWVIFFIGIGYLFDMMTGANAQIISFSRYYRAGMVFIMFLLILVIILLYLLIPIYGITGAAIAIAVSLMLYNIMRYVFIFIKMKLQPFDWRTPVTALTFTGIYFVTTLVPKLPLIPDILVRGAIITILTLTILLSIPLSKEFTVLVEKYKPVIFGKFRKE